MAVAYLLDTNVVSELRKAVPNRHLVAWHEREAGAEAYVSALAIGEIRQGIERLRARAPDQAAEFEAWIDRLEHDYADHILPISADVADEWGRLNAPVALPVVDTLLAATAKVHDLTLVTRNRKDVVRTGVPLLDPFAAE